jgi:hypothetical protein
MACIEACGISGRWRDYPVMHGAMFFRRFGQENIIPKKSLHFDFLWSNVLKNDYVEEFSFIKKKHTCSPHKAVSNSGKDFYEARHDK